MFNNSRISETVLFRASWGAIETLLLIRCRAGEPTLDSNSNDARIHSGAIWEYSPVVFFEIRGEIADVETFAVGKSIRELPRLRKLASGIGKKEFKIKRFLD